MNTTERIVEAYFRICRRCFTSPDVKVIGGNNRQIDLLAYNLMDKQVFHVETSVTHCETWCPKHPELEQLFDFKFLGRPRPRDGKNTDFAKGKAYEHHIQQTYRSFGVAPEEIHRVFCCWMVAGEENLTSFISSYCASRGLTEHPIEILSFRDQVLPALQQSVGSSNYEDDVLRTFSLLREYQLQRGRAAVTAKEPIRALMTSLPPPSTP